MVKFDLTARFVYRAVRSERGDEIMKRLVKLGEKINFIRLKKTMILMIIGIILLTITGCDLLPPNPIPQENVKLFTTSNLTEREKLALHKAQTNHKVSMEELQSMVNAIVLKAPDQEGRSARSANSVRSVKMVPLSGKNKFTSYARSGAGRSAVPTEEEPVEVYEFSIGSTDDDNEMFVLASNDIRIGNILALAEGSLQSTSEEFTELIYSYLQNYISMVIFEYESITEEEIVEAVEKVIQEQPENARKIYSTPNGYYYSSSRNDFTPIRGPLLATAWGQGDSYFGIAGSYSYNNYIQFLYAKDPYYTGCVPTAIAQIVTYYNYMDYSNSDVNKYKPKQFYEIFPYLGIWNSEQYDFNLLKNYRVIKNEYTTVAGNGTMGSPYELPADLWFNGTLNTGVSEQWYSFPVIAGERYYIYWNDRFQGNGTKTGDVAVSIRYSDQTNFAYGGTNTTIDSGWNTSQSFIAKYDSTIYVRVRPYNNSSNNYGSYSIVYTQINKRPVNSIITPNVIGNVGALMYHIGRLADATYGPNTTSSNMTKAITAFEKMGYTVPYYNQYDASDFTGTLGTSFTLNIDTNALNKVKEALNSYRPVYARGVGLYKGVGHAWVIDGYGTMSYYYDYFVEQDCRDNGCSNGDIPELKNFINGILVHNHATIIGGVLDYQTMVHCNMGWDGIANGWYLFGMFDTQKQYDLTREGYAPSSHWSYFDNFSVNTGIMIPQKP